MYQLSSSDFVLVIVDVDEPSVQICATNKLRRLHKSRTCENLSLSNLNIKTENADQLCCRTA